MEIGIDKLTLTTKEFRVTRSADTGLILKPTPYKLGEAKEPDSLLFVDRQGTEVRGGGAFMQDSNKLFTVDINSNGLLVIVNPSKPYHPYLLASDTQTVSDRMQTVERELRKKGILLNMGEAKINRIDVARNIETVEPVSGYGQVFSFLNMPRAKTQASYPDGYSSGNNSRGVIAYNKLQECREKGGLAIEGNNLLRVELQNKKTSAVKRFMKLNNYNELLMCGVEHCADVYKHTIQNEIFKVKPFNEQTIIPFGNSIEVMQELKRKYPQSWERRYREMFGLNELIRSHGSINNYLELVSEVSGNRETVRRVKNHLQNNLIVYEQLMTNDTVSKRYNEILNKLVA